MDVTLFGGMHETHSLETAARTPTFMGCRGVSYNTCQILLVLAVNITGTMEPSLVGPEIYFLSMSLPLRIESKQMQKIILASKSRCMSYTES